MIKCRLLANVAGWSFDTELSWSKEANCTRHTGLNDTRARLDDPMYPKESTDHNGMYSLKLTIVQIVAAMTFIKLCK
jgi:hypothetical protein